MVYLMQVQKSILKNLKVSFKSSFYNSVASRGYDEEREHFNEKCVGRIGFNDSVNSVKLGYNNFKDTCFNFIPMTHNKCGVSHMHLASHPCGVRK